MTRSQDPSAPPVEESPTPAKKAGAKKKPAAAKKKPAQKKAAAKKQPKKKTADKKAEPKQAKPKKTPKRPKVAPGSDALSTLTAEDLASISSNRGLIRLLKGKGIKTGKVLRTLRYEAELERLQIELVQLQRSVQLEGRRVAILFEGRDAAGKGGAIRRFIEHLNPRTARVVALSKPTEVERGQWYFQRYTQALPNAGEICFFDRSWYNRAVVEPVMGFCDETQYQRFMQQVPEFEHMLYEAGIELIKFWFSISKEVQEERFESRRTDPLKQWKISPVDEEAQKRWDVYTRYKEQMFARTHTTFSPWIIVKANSKKRARLESARYVLNTLPYKGKGKAGTSLLPDPQVVRRFHRAVKQIDT